MQKFGKTLITDSGRRMLVQVDGAQGQITYTNAALFTQDIKDMSEEEQIALTALTGQQLITPVSVTQVTDTTVTVSASFNNSKVTEDLKFNSIGWYAKTSVDKQEQLMAVTPSLTEQTLVAGAEGASTSSLDIDMVFGRSHNTTVVLNPNQEGLVTYNQLKAETERIKVKFRKEEVDTSTADINLNNITSNSEGVVPIANMGLAEVKKDFPKNHRLPLFTYDLGKILRKSDVSLAHYKVRYDDINKTVYQEISFYGVYFYRSFLITNNANNNYIWNYKSNYEYSDLIILDNPINFKQTIPPYDENLIIQNPANSNFLLPYGKFMLPRVADGIDSIKDYGEPVLRTDERAMLENTIYFDGPLLKYTLFSSHYLRMFYLVGSTWKEVGLT